MSVFINSVLDDIVAKQIDLNKSVFILPNKRTGFVLINEISKKVKKTLFAPKVFTIEEFVKEISDLNLAKNTELLFELYNIYCEINKDKTEIDDFENFLKWGQLLIQDFNEIDRYLIDQDHVFDYLFSIKEINHWSLEPQKSELIKNYLNFWAQLKVLYHKFSEALIHNKKTYQGLIYREATSNLETFIQSNDETIYIFLGFNALNTSESLIIQELLDKNKALVYWDIDHYFLKHKNHISNLFIKQYLSNWQYYKKQPLLLKSDSYLKPKNINVISVPKLVGQAKCIGNIINKISKKDLEKTAVILGEEHLLEPLLESLPPRINKVNITMGLPLKNTPLSSLFYLWFQLQTKSDLHFYHKDLINFISHPYIKEFLKLNGADGALKIRQYIKENNNVHISLQTLLKIEIKLSDKINLLFTPWNQDTNLALDQISNLIYKMKSELETLHNNALFSEYLYRFNTLFNELKRLNDKYKHLNNVKTLSQIYNQLLNTETLDFSGEPLEGLQIMGMLEARVLDFDTVIISSVNEGILPSGKSENSYIPYDVKIENNLPTYKDKDAVYSYHFFRLLQRAKHIYIIYNTEADALKGGEQSRFIKQLEIEKIHQIQYYSAIPKIDNQPIQLKKINKTQTILDQLKKLASQGFSPSSLNNYIRNPLDFYYQSILNIKEAENVEESLASNSFGTIVHQTLENLYQPIIGKTLNINFLTNLFPKIETLITQEFFNYYHTQNYQQGKNKIIYEVAKQYVKNFIQLEIDLLKKGHVIKILELEADCKCTIPVTQLDFPVYLRGKIDRIDTFDGVLRVIDYKTGKVTLGEVEIVNYENITTDYGKFSKSFQLLTYVYMLKKNNKINLPVQAGIYSFKNLNAGFLKFSKKDKSGRGAKKDSLMTQEMIDIFERELQKLILEICNRNVDFVEKEIK